MAFQDFYNRQGILLTPYPHNPAGVASATSTQIDAVGESVGMIGHINLSTGPGTSKVLSTGKIWWKAGTITLANALSTLKIGVQDVAATGLEDGTYDVSGQVVGGGAGVPTTNAINSMTMASGTKTIAHGDLIAVVFELTARAGVDVVQVMRCGTSGILPYGTTDIGALAKANTLPIVTIEFDDGTMGWFSIDSAVWNQATSPLFSNASTPDEHALVFRLPFPATVIGLFGVLSSVASTDDFEFILYSDPLGTPAVVQQITQDADFLSTGAFYERGITSLSLSANTDYAIALRPTTTGTLAYTRLEYGAGNSALRAATMLGTNWYLGTRTNQTGAFTPDTTILPLFGLRISQFSDGAGGSGGAHSAVF